MITTRSRIALGALLLALLVGLLAAPPTSAQEPFSVDVTPTTDLSDGETVSVDVAGVPDGQGIYLMYCIDVGGRASGDQCDSDTQAWVSTSPVATGMGAQDAADSPFDLQLPAAFGDHDCREVTCGVQTRRDHFGSDDTSLDTFTPVTFAVEDDDSELPTEIPPPPPTEDPTDDPTDEPTEEPTTEEPTTEEPTERPSEDVPFDVTVTPTTGLAERDQVQVTVRGLPAGTGIYVQLCAQQPTGRATGAQCEGEGAQDSGLWVIADYPYPGPAPEGVVDPTEGSVTLAVARTFHDVDCVVATCGIQTRRDHRASGDTSLDTFTPIAFAAAVPQTPGDVGAAPAAEPLPATGTEPWVAVLALMLVAAGAPLVRRGRTTR